MLASHAADVGVGRPAVPAALEEARLVAILRHTDPRLAVRIAEALAAGGVRVLEITLNSVGALDMLRAIAEALGDRVLLGAGTVLDVPAAEDALLAGAAFVVSPHADPALIRAVAERSVPIVPGAFTASEVVAAWAVGASLVKLFPAGPVGPGYIKDLRGPLGHIPLLPTGGLTLDNARSFIQAGAWGLGLGSGLVDPRLVAESRFDELTRHAAVFADMAQQARSRGGTVP